MADHRCYSEFRGGGTGALDAEDGNNLAVGDHSVVRREDIVAEYIVKSSSASESFPFVIAPDTNPGTLRHHLVTQTGLLHSYKETADTVDEEMNDIGNFTVIAGSSGTVSLSDTSSSTARYDFGSSPGSCLLQVGGTSSVDFRKSYTMADTKSIVLALSSPTILDSSVADDPGVAAGETPSMFMLLSDNATYGSGNGVEMAVSYGGTNRAPVYSRSLSSGTPANLGHSYLMFTWTARVVYLRIERDGSKYRFWSSLGGHTWNYMNEYTPSATASYLHLRYLANNPSTPNVVTRLFWLREGGNKVDPWPFL